MICKKKIYFILLVVLVLGKELLGAKNCGPMIGDSAPDFKAESTKGVINFPQDFQGKWIIFFSHPSDFTPVCATEFKRLASMVDEFKSLNTQVMGLSVDSEYTHELWLRDLESEMNNRKQEEVETQDEKEQKKDKKKVNFPVISDPDMKVARLYGMVHPNESKTQTVRAVYFIDPAGKIRAEFFYPLANGRGFKEVKRLLIALQTTDKKDVATSADWGPEDPTIPMKDVLKDKIVDE